MAVTGRDTWAADGLAALRTKHNLTQAALAEKAGIDRSAYNALENGRRRITLTYAERLAPHLGLSDPRRLLPPEEQPKGVEDPLVRLAALEEEVAQLRSDLDRFVRSATERRAEIEEDQELPTRLEDRPSTRDSES